jgi:hypothetical protein
MILLKVIYLRVASSIIRFVREKGGKNFHDEKLRAVYIYISFYTLYSSIYIYTYVIDCVYVIQSIFEDSCFEKKTPCKDICLAIFICFKKGILLKQGICDLFQTPTQK